MEAQVRSALIAACDSEVALLNSLMTQDNLFEFYELYANQIKCAKTKASKKTRRYIIQMLVRSIATTKAQIKKGQKRCRKNWKHLEQLGVDPKLYAQNIGLAEVMKQARKVAVDPEGGSARNYHNQLRLFWEEHRAALLETIARPHPSVLAAAEEVNVRFR